MLVRASPLQLRTSDRPDGIHHSTPFQRVNAPEPDDLASRLGTVACHVPLSDRGDSVLVNLVGLLTLLADSSVRRLLQRRSHAIQATFPDGKGLCLSTAGAELPL